MQTSKLIFYIGDPKQSIYKFRGADLNNYLKIKDSLDQKNIFGLTKNYRSHPSLVTAVNNFLELKEKVGFKGRKAKRMRVGSFLIPESLLMAQQETRILPTQNFLDTGNQKYVSCLI